MAQQINLYQTGFRPQRWTFATLLFLGAGIGLVLLLLFYIVMHWQTASLRAEHARLQQQQDTISTQLEAVAQQFPAKTLDVALEQELVRAQAELAAKRSTVQAATADITGNIAGFSAYLEGLARQRPHGLWLRGVTLAAGGTRIEIIGSTLVPNLVPTYIQRLGDEEVFANLQFRTLLMERPEPTNAKIDFTLRTSGETAPTAAGTP